MEELDFNRNDIKDLFMQIGLASPNGNYYQERLHKHGQLYDYLVIIRAALKKMTTKRPLVLVDCGCGRSYLSFFLNYVLKNEGHENLYFMCVDTNKKLIDQCRITALELGLTNMEFIESSIIDCRVERNVDIVYSLHACDIATDQTITKGVLNRARYIFSVSCCQHTVKSQIKKQPLNSVTRYNQYKERVADMVSDSLRGLLLESLGYKVEIFEFTPSSNTPKNVMLRAERIDRNRIREEKAIDGYTYLSEMFHIKPALEAYLQNFLMHSTGE